MKIILNIFAILLISIPSSAFELPEGYRYPIESDMIGGWINSGKEVSKPYHVNSDLDGNGEIDQAWILLKYKEQGWGLFVLLNGKRLIELDSSKESYPQNMGISVLAVGNHKTACGKGYWACKPGEPEILELKNPGLLYFAFESAASVFYWDRKNEKFLRTWLSD